MNEDQWRQEIAKTWRRKLRIAKTKANNVKSPYDPIEGLSSTYIAAVTKVRRVVEQAYDAFDQPGMYWPDGWHEYQRALDDVDTALRYGRPIRF